ncbi:MAG: hypothetical protein ABSA01_14520 [Anaerolineales bacterium]
MGELERRQAGVQYHRLAAEFFMRQPARQQDLLVPDPDIRLIIWL